MSSTDPSGGADAAEQATPPREPAEPAPPSHQVDAAEAVRAEGRRVLDGTRRLAFRHSRLTIAAALVVVAGALPLLFSVPFFWLFLLVPLAVIGWVLRVRTTVDADAVTARSLTRTRTVAWDEVRGLRLGTRSSVTVVLADGDEVVLPAVHVRDLPVLAIASGGRFADPAGEG